MSEWSGSSGAGEDGAEETFYTEAIRLFQESHADIVEYIANAPSAPHAAAVWWASAVRNPSLGSGNSTIDAFFKDAAESGLARSKPELEPAALESFSRELVRLLGNDFDLTNEDERRGGLWDIDGSLLIRVDYSPDQILSYAAQNAGLHIEEHHWPSKSFTRVSEDRVIARLGEADVSTLIWQRQPEEEGV